MISVLMSVYNETPDEICQSLDSVLSQSYADFELIIVLDQPEYVDALALLQEYANKDARIRILVNKNNIGLALSMNVAAEHAQGEYLLRMDADDICLPDRFQLQYDAICTGEYDLICGNYDYIDETGNPIPQKTEVYSDSQLSTLLPYRNIIHHPTVIMTSKIFHDVGGYRNYPCAQDYDLWLRMKCIGARMHMLSEKLIQYRVRQASTTNQKRYKQSCTVEYIRILYQKSNMNGYSYEGYLQYLENRGVNNPNANENFIENFERYIYAKKCFERRQFLCGSKALLYVAFCSKYFRPHLIRAIKYSLIAKLKK